MEFLVERVGNRSFERGNAATATMMRREKVKEISEQKILSTEFKRIHRRHLWDDYYQCAYDSSSQVLTDRTNSLLRQNTTSTTEELLEWTKSICSNYSNIKVHPWQSFSAPISILGDKLWHKLAQWVGVLCFDPQFLPRSDPLQPAQVWKWSKEWIVK